MPPIQFGRVAIGDRVWIVNTTAIGQLVTIGYLDVREQPVSRAEARRRLGYEPWKAKYHLFAPAARAQRPRRVALQHIAGQLRFESPLIDRLAVKNGRVNAQQLQTMRRLTRDSARRVQSAWDGGMSAQDREYSSLNTALQELGELDAKRARLERKEQRLLRRMLLEVDGSSRCIVCGHDFPLGLLVAAHIRPRSKCSDRQRRDYVNNIAAMCKLGCDELYERGYIVVKNGRLHADPQATTPAVRAYLERLDGKRCIGLNAKRATYFDWHAKHHKSRD